VRCTWQIRNNDTRDVQMMMVMLYLHIYIQSMLDPSAGGGCFRRLRGLVYACFPVVAIHVIVTIIVVAIEVYRLAILSKTVCKLFAIY